MDASFFFGDTLYKRKTTRRETPIAAFQQAAKAISQEKMSIRAAADRFGINFMTLYRYVKKSKLAPDNPPSVGYAKPSKIFTQQQE
jgi:transposase